MDDETRQLVEGHLEWLRKVKAEAEDPVLRGLTIFGAPSVAAVALPRLVEVMEFLLERELEREVLGSEVK